MDRTAAHAHRVHHRHTAGGDVVAVAHPSAGLPAECLVEVGAGPPDEVEQRLRLGVDRLGRSGDAAVDLKLYLVSGFDAGAQVGEIALEPFRGGRAPGTDVEAQDRVIGHHVVRRAALDLGRIYPKL